MSRGQAANGSLPQERGSAGADRSEDAEQAAAEEAAAAPATAPAGIGVVGGIHQNRAPGAPVAIVVMVAPSVAMIDGFNRRPGGNGGLVGRRDDAREAWRCG